MRVRLIFAALIFSVASCVTAPSPAPATDIATVPDETGLVAPDFRLPQTAVPRRYDLDLTIIPTEDSFSGSVGIDLDILEPVDAIWLHAEELELERALLRVGGRELTPRIVQKEGGFAGFLLPETVPLGRARLDIDYTGVIHTESSDSIYARPEGDDWYVYTFFEPVDARKAFPSFDEPGYKVPWRLTLRVPDDEVALANTPIVSETSIGDGLKVVRFAESKPLPSYLVAFIVGPFHLVEAGAAGQNDVTVRIAVPRGRESETAFAAESTPIVVDLLERYFEMPYPFEKLDVAVVPAYWGTMEHPGLVAMGQPLTLIKPEDDGPSARQAYVRILAHELAHYWFGDLVTMEWWDDLWLNEALATWLDEKITDQFEPQWNYPLDQNFYRWRAMWGDALSTTRSLRQSVTTPAAIFAAFDNDVTYFKGAEVLGMVEEWVGEETFRRILQDYLERHAWGNTTSDDLIDSIRRVGGEEAAAIVTSFVDQAGVPVIRTSLLCGDGTPRVSFSQNRFLADPEATAEERWTVPICLRLPNDERACHLLDRASQTFDLPMSGCPEYLQGNLEGRGYYRTLYDDQTASLLLQNGMDELSPSERLVLISDYEAFARRGDVTLERTLRIAEAVGRASRERAVLGAVAGLYVLVAQDVAEPDELEPLRDAAAPVFLKRAREIGWGSRDDSEAVRLLRGQLMWAAALLHDPELGDAAIARLPRYLEERSGIDPDVTQPFLRAVGSRGGSPEYDQILAAARHTDDRTWRTQLLTGLAFFQAPELTERTFGILRSGEFDSRETLPMSLNLFRRIDPEEKERSYEFLLSDWQSLVRDLRDEEASFFLETPDILCDRHLLERARKDLPPLAATVDGGEYALSKALENAAACVRLRESQHPSLRQYLNIGRSADHHHQ